MLCEHLSWIILVDYSPLDRAESECRTPETKRLRCRGGTKLLRNNPCWCKSAIQVAAQGRECGEERVYYRDENGRMRFRARPGAESKKTAMNEVLPQSVAGEDWGARYEQLRKDVLSQATGGGFGLIILLRQGMIAWMRACAEAPVPATARESVRQLNTISGLPSDVRSQAAVILAGILLHHPTESMLCKVTCTR